MLPLLYAVLLWWFTTGLIIALSRRSQRTLRLAFGVGTLLALAAFYAIFVSARAAAPANVYIAFTCGIVIWGWLVAGYYFGIVTGPQDSAQPIARPATLRRRFQLALRSSLHHELLIVGAALVMIGLTWSQPNRWGLWIFVALWLMHSSAKLCVFLGVRNFRIGFLPSHLRHVQDLLGRQSNNLLLPISVCIASSAALALLYRAIMPEAHAGHTVGSLLVAVMLILGIIEHLLLVLPLPATLFGWGVRSLSSLAADAGSGGPGAQPVAAEIAAEITTERADAQPQPKALSLPSFVEQHWESFRA